MDSNDNAEEACIDLDDACLIDFLQMAPTAELVASLRAKDSDDKFGASPQAALLKCLRHPTAVSYPPGRPYREKLLTQSVLAAERDGCELNDELAEAHAEALTENPDNRTETDNWCYKTFVLDCCCADDDNETRDGVARDERHRSHTSTTASVSNALPITIKTHPNLFEGGTGCHEWAAGFTLAELIVSFPKVFESKIVAEIGPGVGVSAVCLAKQTNCKTIHLLDREPETLGNLTSNLGVNGVGVVANIGTNDGLVNDDDTLRTVAGKIVHPPICLTRLDWFDFNEQVMADLKVDVVIAADVLYDPLDVPGVLDATKALLGVRREVDSIDKGARNKFHFLQRNEKCAIFVSALRQPATLALFEKVATERGFEPIDVTAVLPVHQSVGFRRLGSVQRTEIRVHVLRPPVE